VPYPPGWPVLIPPLNVVLRRPPGLAGGHGFFLRAPLGDWDGRIRTDGVLSLLVGDSQHHVVSGGCRTTERSHGHGQAMG